VSKTEVMPKTVSTIQYSHALPRQGLSEALLKAVAARILGEGSVAEGEYPRNMKDTRLCPDGTARGSRSATALRPSRKNDLTGRNISTWRKYRTRMTAGRASTRTAPNRGLARV
jgi:hypothetical protein